MKKTVLKGWHRPLSLIPPFMRNIVLPGDSITDMRIYRFEDTCRYTLDNGDQMDWNKLYGYCNGVHYNSGRIVWRYNPNTDKIELAAYCYDRGVRTYRILGEANINEDVLLSVSIIENIMSMKLYGVFVNNVLDSTKQCEFEIKFEESFKNKFKFSCDLYFGGNNTAPQRITIQMNKL